jgi:hypothetical protein
VSPADSLCYPSESHVHCAALMTLCEAIMRKAQRRIRQHGWDTKVDIRRVFY